MSPIFATPTPIPRKAASYTGVLIGTAVGDSLGLPAEGLRPETIRRRWKGVWKHRFVFERGIFSDDTEHATLVAQCLLEHPVDAEAFQRALARRLRWWLAALPAGVGFATVRSILKLWLGFPPRRSGVASAGNGPMMRSAIIGARFGHDPERRKAFVTASTRITHTDTRAEIAAHAIAEIAAGLTCADKPVNFDPLPVLRQIAPDPLWQELVDQIAAAKAANLSVQDFAITLGLSRGITGYAWHTAPVAIYAWWKHRGDFRAALESVLNCGGDTDTVGAIVGALAGAELGHASIPNDWIAGICEWPRSTAWLHEVGVALSQNAHNDAPSRPPAFFWPGIVARNVFFLGAVLTHGVLRLIR